jgi:hypothetical protein
MQRRPAYGVHELKPQWLGPLTADVLRTIHKGIGSALTALDSTLSNPRRLHRPQRRNILANARRCRFTRDTDAPNEICFVKAAGPTAWSYESDPGTPLWRLHRLWLRPHRLR